MKPAALNAIRDLIQEDVGRRGLQTDPERNLINALPDDFASACRSIAAHKAPAVGIVTGFYIPHAHPPAAETDGPLGALFLARALVPLGIRMVLLTDSSCRNALQVGLRTVGLEGVVGVLTLPSIPEHWNQFLSAGWLTFAQTTFRLTHLIALERPGPSHTLDSLASQLGPGSILGGTYMEFLNQVPIDHQNRYHNMAGRDITQHNSPAHLLFESVANMPGITTIGIGDGGNEIGMGKLAWDVIRRNIPGGALIACRAPTDHLIVCGISNWGAYGLAAGVLLLRDRQPASDLFAPEREQFLLEEMVRQGPLVDGLLARQTPSVDGVPFESYARPLRQMADLLRDNLEIGT